MYYCSPCVFISIRVHNRQDVDVQVIQDVSDVLILAIKGQRLWVEQKFNEKTFFKQIYSTKAAGDAEVLLKHLL